MTSLDPATTPFSRLPEPPYYAVIFSSKRTAGDRGYADVADRMVALAAQQPGFLGIESAREADGFDISVSYWASEAAIAAWRAEAEHLAAQDKGKHVWYEHFELRVARVERSHGGAGRGIIVEK